MAVVDPNLEWLGYVQPVGLVLSPAILYRYGLVPEEQSRADGDAVAACLAPAESLRALADPWKFFARILGWREHQVAGLRLDPFRREVFRDGRYVALTRKQFAVLEVLIDAGGGVVSAEQLLERAWDENADPFTNAVRITVSSLRKRLGEPWLILTVPGVGYRIGTDADG